MPTLVADFEDGVDGWYTDGSLRYETNKVHSGTGAIRVDNTDTSGSSEYAINLPNNDNDLPAYPQLGDTFEMWISVDNDNDTSARYSWGVQNIDSEYHGFSFAVDSRQSASDGRDAFNVNYRDGDGNQHEIIQSPVYNDIWSESEYRRVVIDWQGGGGGGPGGDGYVLESGEGITTGIEGDNATMFVSGEPVFDQGGESYVIESGTALTKGGSVEITATVFDTDGTQLAQQTGQYMSEADPLPAFGGMGMNLGSYYGSSSSSSYMDDVYILD